MEPYNYTDAFPINISLEVRRKNDIGDLYINQAKCFRCDQIIVSKNRHDMVTCSCGNLSVDGGSWYAKRSYKTLQWEDMTIYYTKGVKHDK